MDEQANGELERRFQQLDAQLADLRTQVEALEVRADTSSYRVTKGEGRTDLERGRTDRLEARADVAGARADATNHRADASEARADTQDVRMDTIQGRLDVDDALIAELQLEGVLSKDHTEHLKEALRTSRTIATAMGLIMANRNVDETDAFAILSKASQDSNRKLRVIADEVLRAGDVSMLPSA